MARASVSSLTTGGAATPPVERSPTRSSAAAGRVGRRPPSATPPDRTTPGSNAKHRPDAGCRHAAMLEPGAARARRRTAASASGRLACSAAVGSGSVARPARRGAAVVGRRSARRVARHLVRGRRARRPPRLGRARRGPRRRRSSAPAAGSTASARSSAASARRRRRRPACRQGRVGGAGVRRQRIGSVVGHSASIGLGGRRTPTWPPGVTTRQLSVSSVPSGRTTWIA